MSNILSDESALAEPACYFGFETCFICPGTGAGSDVKPEVFEPSPWPPASPSEENNTSPRSPSERRDTATLDEAHKTQSASASGLVLAATGDSKRVGGKSKAPMDPGRPKEQTTVSHKRVASARSAWNMAMGIISDFPEEYRKTHFAALSAHFLDSVSRDEPSLDRYVPDSITSDPGSIFEWGRPSEDGNVPSLRNKATGWEGYLIGNRHATFSNKARETAIRMISSRPEMRLDKAGVASLIHTVYQTFYPFDIQEEGVITMVTVLLDSAYPEYLSGDPKSKLFFLGRPRSANTSEVKYEYRPILPK